MAVINRTPSYENRTSPSKAAYLSGLAGNPIRATALAVCTFIAAPSGAYAVVQLDQSFDDSAWTTTASSSINAQTYTAGLTGKLTVVAVHISSAQPAALEIRNVDPSGAPGSLLLARASFAASASLGLVEVPLTAPIDQVAGTQYAIVVTTGDPNVWVTWAGRSGDYYPAGALYLGANSMQQSDLYFKTYVDAPDEVAPQIAVTSPYEAATYSFRSRVQALYSCSDNVQVATCIGDVPNGGLIDTSTSGTKQFTLHATDTSGNVSTRTINYSVLPASSGRSPRR